MTGRAQLPDTLPTPAPAVIARLLRWGLVVRSVWFPNRQDLASWGVSGCPLYVRPLAPDRIEVGPHLISMWAAVFSPVLEVRFHADRLEVRRRLPHVTTAVLVTWGVVVTVWAAGLVLGAQVPPPAIWMVVASSTVAAPLFGWTLGGRALEAGLPWLVEVLLAPDDEEDW